LQGVATQGLFGERMNVFGICHDNNVRVRDAHGVCGRNFNA